VSGPDRQYNEDFYLTSIPKNSTLSNIEYGVSVSALKLVKDTPHQILKLNMSLVERFTSRAGQVIRVQGTNAEPTFCAKDVCEALGIVNHRDKVARLDEDEKLTSVEPTGRGTRMMLFVTEPGLYSIILTCRESTISGTAAHAFRRWVTHEVLPSIRKNGRYQLEQRLKIAARDEKGRRLWNVVKALDIYNFNARRKHFGKICEATKALCYVDEFGSPHVHSESIEEAGRVIRETMGQAVLDAVPEGQNFITDYFRAATGTLN